MSAYLTESMLMQVPWRGLHCLTPDATQLADEAWMPQEPAAVAGNPGMHSRWIQTAAQAKAGDIAPLRLMALDVVMASTDGQDRSAPLLPCLNLIQTLRYPCCELWQRS